MKKAIMASFILLFLIGYSLWNRRVIVPMSKVYVHIPFDAKPRLWANAVEFDHYFSHAEICYSLDGKSVKCDRLKKASPK